jgi:hypothetical protein
MGHFSIGTPIFEPFYSTYRREMFTQKRVFQKVMKSGRVGRGEWIGAHRPGAGAIAGLAIRWAAGEVFKRRAAQPVPAGVRIPYDPQHGAVEINIGGFFHPGQLCFERYQDKRHHDPQQDHIFNGGLASTGKWSSRRQGRVSHMISILCLISTQPGFLNI